MLSALSHLDCSECSKRHDVDRLQTVCRHCGSPLLARYDFEAARKTMTRAAVRGRPRGMWRWLELLPIRQMENQLTLGEGDTPLLPLERLGAKIGLKHLTIKDESGNPTGSFKARGLAVAVSKAVELGVRSFSIPTAGNAGAALAAYAARAQRPAHVYMPKDTPLVIQHEIVRVGAQVVLVDGLINDAGRLAAADAKKHGRFDVSTFKEPYRLEGKKTMGFELVEHFEGELPDVVVYPTGGGTGLAGMWKAFDEMERLGWIGAARPRMVSVQAAGCAPVVRAFEDGQEQTQPWENAHTIASGLRVPAPFAGRLMLRVLRESHGTALAVSDDEIQESLSELATLEGLLACPEGAATWAAVQRLTERGWVQPGERVVLFNTGSGLKYL
jgi:threonine synthase